MTQPQTSTFVARNPTDLVALVPVVLGFHPADSVVLLTFGSRGGAGSAAFHARVDLPVDRAEQEEVAEVLLGAVSANRVQRVAVLLYTDDVEVARSQLDLLLGRLLEAEVEVIDVLRVDDGCWHPLPEDGSPGTPYDLDGHPFTAQGVFEGHVVHRDRAELADTLVGTDEHDETAVALAATRFADLVGSSRESGLLRTEARWLQRFIRSRLAAATVTPRAGDPVTVADAGRVLALASLVETRDVAWAEISRSTSAGHVDLWRALVRRAPRHLLPGACSLLAFAAWQHGDGALAWCAVDRCLEVDPDHSMAHCVAQLLTGAVPPGIWEPISETDLAVFRSGEGDGGSAERVS